MRALTILDTLVENGGTALIRKLWNRIRISSEKFCTANGFNFFILFCLALYNDENLLERLKIVGSDTSTDPRVKKRTQSLFYGWNNQFQGQRDYERLCGLYQQRPSRSRSNTKTRYDSPASLKVVNPSHSRTNSNVDSLTSSSKAKVERKSYSPTPFLRSDRKSATSSKKIKSLTPAELKATINQTLAEANTAAINLGNALQLLDREEELSTDSEEATKAFNKCKQLRRQILKLIHSVEREEYIGALIHANEELIKSLKTYDEMSKPLGHDSDSEDWRIESKVRHLNMSDDEYSDSELSDDDRNGKNNTVKLGRQQQQQQGQEEDYDDDPFADSNVVLETPVYEKPKMNF